MPVWCKNYLEISGSAEDLENFDNQFKNGGIDVRYDHIKVFKKDSDHFDGSKYLIYKVYEYQNNFLVRYIKDVKPRHNYSLTSFRVPSPDFFLQGLNPITFTAEDLWNTKWDLYDMSTKGFVATEPEITYEYLTAWSPCDYVIKNMICHYPNIRFHYEYEEKDSQIAGKIVGFNGEIIEEKHVNVDGFRQFLKDEFRQDLEPCPHCGVLLFRSEFVLKNCPKCECKLSKEE